MPLVSGTFTKTNTHDTAHTTAYMPKRPARPIDLSSTGSEYVTMMLQIQDIRKHTAMQMPRTRVGKISVQSMFGIGPNPITKKKKQSTTLTVDNAAFMTFPILTMVPMTNMRRDSIRSGIVVSSKLLHAQEAKNKR